MPDTRSGKSKADEGEQNSELIQIITSKFNELKQDLITEIKLLIQLEVEKVVKKQKEEFDETVIKLQEQITMLEQEKDDLEQYGRRVCVRIDDVPVESEETAESVFEKVGKFLGEACPDVPVSCIDRAHRIGSEYKSYRNKKKCCSIIVRFMSFRHRTMFYRNRKRLKDVRIKLDLTKRRYKILKDAIDLAKEHPDLNYVYADVNCRLKVVFKDGSSNFFNDIDDLKSIRNNRIQVMKQRYFNAH